MSRCLEADVLVSVGTSLDWQPEQALQHLTDCEECRGRLRQLAALHDALAGELEPTRDFTDSVMQSLVKDSVARSSDNRRVGLPILINPALAAATAFFVVALARAGESLPQQGTSLFVAALLVAIGTLWWNWTHAKPLEQA